MKFCSNFVLNQHKNVSELIKKAPSLGLERQVKIMYIEETEWLDKEGKEAILKVVNDKKV